MAVIPYVIQQDGQSEQLEVRESLLGVKKRKCPAIGRLPNGLAWIWLVMATFWAVIKKKKKLLKLSYAHSGHQ